MQHAVVTSGKQHSTVDAMPAGKGIPEILIRFLLSVWTPSGAHHNSWPRASSLGPPHSHTPLIFNIHNLQAVHLGQRYRRYFVQAAADSSNTISTHHMASAPVPQANTGPINSILLQCVGRQMRDNCINGARLCTNAVQPTDAVLCPMSASALSHQYSPSHSKRIVGQCTWRNQLRILVERQPSAAS
jgi:hypothetical protein